MFHVEHQYLPVRSARASRVTGLAFHVEHSVSLNTAPSRPVVIPSLARPPATPNSTPVRLSLQRQFAMTQSASQVAPRASRDSRRREGQRQTSRPRVALSNRPSETL